MRTIQIVGAISLFTLSVSEQRATAGDSVLSLKSAADYLWVGENSAFHLTKAFTLEAWVNVVSSLNEEQTVVAKPKIHYTEPTLLPLISQSGYALRINQGAVELALDNDVETVRSVNLNGVWDVQSNRWYHVAATYDGAVGKVYIGGVLKGSQSFTRNQEPSNSLTDVPPLTIGGELLGYISGGWYSADGFPLRGNTHPFFGKIDEVRIWARALSQDEIRAGMTNSLAGNEQDLQGYWNFDSGSGGQLMGQAELISGVEAFPSVVLIADRFSWLYGYRFAIQAEPDLAYQLETSTNLRAWTPLVRVQPSVPSLVYVDPTATNFVELRFYRLRRAP
jgi:Concanavalin A-like lectin/glucanases superfamily